MALSTHLQYCTRSSSTYAPNFSETAEALSVARSRPPKTPLLHLRFGHELMITQLISERDQRRSQDQAAPHQTFHVTNYSEVQKDLISVGFTHWKSSFKWNFRQFSCHSSSVTVTKVHIKHVSLKALRSFSKLQNIICFDSQTLRKSRDTKIKNHLLGVKREKQS